MTSSKVNYPFVYLFILLTTITFFQIIHADGTFELNVTPKCKGKPCSMYLKLCLRNYMQVINHESDCSYGEAIISPKEYGQVQKIEFNFSWPRDFSLVIEGYNSSDLSERHAAKNRIFRDSFQEVLQAQPEWKEQLAYHNTTSISIKMRIFCDEHSFGRQCSRECVPRNNELGHYECTENGVKRCLPGWQGEGSNCVTPVCADGCRNGTCKVPGGCDCNEGFEGVHCDKCKVFPGCKHGTCKGPFECNCDEGWAGLACDKDLNFCTHHSPCINGVCFNEGEGSYTCECVFGFTGTNCDIPFSDCSTLPCMNGGNCSQSSPTSNYTCDCPAGFTGINCETPLSSECDWKLCENGGTCSNGPSGYLCICPPGYTGPNCEIRVTSCNQFPCFNGATCTSSSSSSYSCNCRAGFNGSHCENNINDCASDVEMCFNGGTCIDGINSYTCSCAPGFTGPSCQTNIDECSSNPCKNGGQCTDLINGFSCKCPPGFSGIDCSSLSEPTPPPPTCNPQYCFNGGTCKVTTYTATSSSSTRTSTSFAICLCRPGFSGFRCEYPPGVLALVRSEKSLPDSLETTTEHYKSTDQHPKQLVVHFTTPVPAPVSSFSSFERIISTSDMTLISVVALIVPLAIIIFILFRFSKQRIRVEERKKYENEEAIRQNEENSSKKCLQNDSCLIYNDLNRDSMRIVNGHPALSLSHPHLHPSLLSPGTLSPTNTLLTTASPQCSSSILSSSSLSSCNNKKLANDDYIVNELTIDPNLTIYGLTPPPTLPPLTLSTDPSGISTTTSHSCHPSPVYSKYATLTSHHLHPHLHQSGSVVDLHYLHHIVT